MAGIGYRSAFLMACAMTFSDLLYCELKIPQQLSLALSQPALISVFRKSLCFEWLSAKVLWQKILAESAAAEKKSDETKKLLARIFLCFWTKKLFWSFFMSLGEKMAHSKLALQHCNTAAHKHYWTWMLKIDSMLDLASTFIKRDLVMPSPIKPNLLSIQGKPQSAPWHFPQANLINEIR